MLPECWSFPSFFLLYYDLLAPPPDFSVFFLTFSLKKLDVLFSKLIIFAICGIIWRWFFSRFLITSSSTSSLVSLNHTFIALVGWERFVQPIWFALLMTLRLGKFASKYTISLFKKCSFFTFMRRVSWVIGFDLQPSWANRSAVSLPLRPLWERIQMSSTCDEFLKQGADVCNNKINNTYGFNVG